MPDDPTAMTPRDGHVTVRYWASARAAAGVTEERLPISAPLTLAALLEQTRALHDQRFGAVLDICSVLVGDRPVGAGDPSQVPVRPGDTVDVLPPFAGG